MPTATGRRTLQTELATVFRLELRRFLMARRTLWTVSLFALAGLGTASLLRRLSESVVEQAAEAGIAADALSSTAGPVLGELLSFVGWGDADTAQGLLEAHVPLAVLGFFVLASWFLPMLVALVAFDRFSDLATGVARYDLLRVRRGTWLAGRWLATAAALSLLLGAMWLGVVAVVLSRADGAHIGAILREAARDAVLLDVLALPYLGLTALISSVSRPGSAFVTTTFVWLGLSVLSAALPHASRPWPLLRWLLPWSWAPGLIARSPVTLASSVVALVTLALALVTLVHLHLRRRDV
ncbi:MAG: hypothetical protein RL199_1599 [Pseudomonadota bacterium]|jgi:hypothetical protein